MDLLSGFNLYMTAPNQASKELVLRSIQVGYIFLRNSARKIVFIFDLVNNTWLLDKLRVSVQIDYPAIATMPLGDVHYGTLAYRGLKEKVVVKALRAARCSSQNRNVKITVIRKLARECYMWSFLRHENICPFRGLDRHLEFEFPVLVSAFVPHQCMDIIYRHPERKFMVVREMADGLNYLHANGIVHGDLKTANIMINNQGRVQIINVREHVLQSVMGVPIEHQEERNTRFSAPEMLRLSLLEGDAEPTFKADIFSFAMTMLQILDGRDTLSIPYNHCPSEFQLWIKLRESGRVERPQLVRYKNVPLTAHDLLQRCWDEVPENRPAMASVVSELRQLIECVPSTRAVYQYV